MQVVIYSSDKTSWALRPFAHLFNLYWSRDQRVAVFGNTPPDFALPANFTFQSVGPFKPVQQWSNDLIVALNTIDDDVICMMMDDYWLNRQVNAQAVRWCYEYMRQHPNAIRFDMTTDRLYANGAQPYGAIGYLDVIKSDPKSQYNLSLQAGLWRRELLLEMLVLNETPWEVEEKGSARLARTNYDVLGTKQSPIHYTIAVQRGKLALNGGYQFPPNPMQQSDIYYLLKSGWIPEGML